MTRTKTKQKAPSSEQTDLAQKAYLGIRQMLFHSEIVPGQKIAYRDLADRLKMSPTPVIQALKFLEFQGLVRREPNRGYYTEPISLQELEEIYETRELIEVSMLPKTLERLNEQGIQQLRQALDEHLQAARDLYLNERILRDMDFHLTLATLSGSQVQLKILRNLFDLLFLKYRNSIVYVTPMEIEDSLHQNLFEAVASRNLPRATEVLTAHISHAKAHVLNGLERMLAEKRDLEI